MTTLYKRATPSQVRILRAVEGAVKNAADAHPEYQIDRRFCRSVAKRAAGTLTAQWPEVLAAKPSDEAGANKVVIARTARQASAELGKRNVRGVTQLSKRSPLRILWNMLTQQMRGVKISGNQERAQAFIDVLRMIDALQCARSSMEEHRNSTPGVVGSSLTGCASLKTRAA